MPKSADYMSMVFWFAVTAAAVLVGFIAVKFVRRWSLHEDAAHAFTIEDLRRMRDRGDITDAEFRAMRGDLLGRAMADMHPKAPPPRPDQDLDKLL